MLKSRRLRLAGYVARMGSWEMRTKFWLEIRDHSEDRGLNGRTILNWILKQVWIGFICLRKLTVLHAKVNLLVL